MIRKIALLTVAAGATMMLLQGVAQAQAESTFPSRPITLIVPFPPGGSVDPVGRLLAQELSSRIGQSVVVENKPGAAASIGANILVRAAPDGYTLLLHTSALAIDQSFKKNVPYNVKRDFTPVIGVATGDYLVVTNQKMPFKNVAEMVQYSKANPALLNYGSSGEGSSSHMIGELFKLSTGAKMTHVPYKGGGPSITGLIGNDVQVLFDTIVGSGPMIRDGKLRALGLTGAQRSPLMPDVPTVGESVPGFAVSSWMGVFAPPATPKPIVDKLYRTLNEVLAVPSVKERLAGMGQTVHSQTPEQLRTALNADVDKWQRVVTESKIEPQ